MIYPKPCPYDELFHKYAGIYKLPWRLIRAQSWVESGFDPNALSPCGAKGLMQLMPATDKNIDGHVDAFDPEGNVKDGVAYLREQFDHFKEIPDLGERLKFSLAAYNGGRGYCVVGETPVVMDDFVSKPIANLKEGDSVLAFDEAPILAKVPRRIKKATVTGTISRHTDTIRLVLEGGQEVISSADHPWLKAAGWNGKRPVENHRFGFIPAAQLRVGQSLMDVMPVLSVPRLDSPLYTHGYLSGAWLGEGCFAAGPTGKNQSVIFSCQSPEFLKAVCDGLDHFGFEYSLGQPNSKKVTHLWIRQKGMGREKEKSRLINLVFVDKKDPDFLRGFLAGIYDAEGSCSRKQLSITQKDSTPFGKLVIERTCSALKDLGFSFHLSPRRNRDISNIKMYGTSNIARFITEVQPKIPHKRIPIYGTSIRGRKQIICIEPFGKKEVFDISTTSGTFLPGGLASHNCNKALELARGRELGSSALAGARPGLWQTWANTSQFLADPLCVVAGFRPDHNQITDYVKKIWAKFIRDVFEMEE